MKFSQLNRLVKPGFGPVAALAIALASQGQLAAQCGVSCPPYTLPSGPNLLANRDFDFVGPCGKAAWWANGTGSCLQDLTASAAEAWTTHSSNNQAMIRHTWSRRPSPVQPHHVPVEPAGAQRRSGIYIQNSDKNNLYANSVMETNVAGTATTGIIVIGPHSQANYLRGNTAE